MGPTNLDGVDGYAYHVVDHTINELPFIETTQVQALHPGLYEKAVEFWDRNPHFSPVNLVDKLVSRQLATQLEWGQRERLGLEHQSAMQVLSSLWKYLDPRTPMQVEEASNAAIIALYDLSDNKTFTPRTLMGEKIMGALSEYVEKVSETSKAYQPKKGMGRSLSILALYTGIPRVKLEQQ